MCLREMETSWGLRRSVIQEGKQRMQFATKTFKMILLFRIGSGMNVARGNCPLTTDSITGSVAMVRFCSPNSRARKRMTPEERKKSPMPSGLKRKHRATARGKVGA
jgi:hypothetical protein